MTCLGLSESTCLPHLVQALGPCARTSAARAASKHALHSVWAGFLDAMGFLRHLEHNALLMGAESRAASKQSRHVVCASLRDENEAPHEVHFLAGPAGAAARGAGGKTEETPSR